MDLLGSVVVREELTDVYPCRPALNDEPAKGATRGPAPTAMVASSGAGPAGSGFGIVSPLRRASEIRASKRLAAVSSPSHIFLHRRQTINAGQARAAPASKGPLAMDVDVSQFHDPALPEVIENALLGLDL